MSGPIDGLTDTLLIGQGFRTLKSTRDYSAKWGPIQLDTLKKAEILDYTYTVDGYEHIIQGDEAISAYWHEVNDIAKVDTTMDPT